MPNNTPKRTKGWSERRRKQQACNARRNKPWQSSTGPRSVKGKEIARMNAWKHGNRAAGAAAIRMALRLNREFLRHVGLFFAAEQIAQQVMARKEAAERAKE